MSIIRTNQQNQVQFWHEAAMGDRPATPIGHLLSIIGHDLGLTQEAGRSRVIRGDPNPGMVPEGRFSLSGRKISVPIEEQMVGLFLYKLLNGYGKSGTPDVTHVFKMIAGVGTNDGPYLGFEVWDAEAEKADVLDGCVIVGVDGEINTDSTEAALNFEVAGCGKGDFDAATQEDGTPATYDGELYSMVNASIEVDGVVPDFVKTGRFTFSRKVSVVPVPDGTPYGRYVILGGVNACTVTLSGLWDDASAIRALATGAAEHYIEFIFAPSTGAHGLTIKYPEMKFRITAASAVGEGNERECSVEGTGYKQDSGDATSFMATLINHLTDYHLAFIPA
jgi:hypothetical protein